MGSAAALAASSALAPSTSVAASPAGRTLTLGVASYSTRKFTLDQTLEMAKALGVTSMTFKDVHIPRTGTPDATRVLREKIVAAGITIMGGGTITLPNDPAEIRRNFEYAKAAGFPLIFTSPDPAALDTIEQMAKEYDIKVAIHNHGPEDKLYPSPVNVYDHIKGLDNRMGLCLDIGHAARAGANPVEVIGKYGNRIFDLHIKDLSEIAVKSRPIELGRGVLDIPGVIKALAKNRYPGYCSIEHEMDMTDPLPGIAESAGYFRGVVKGESY